MSNLGNNYKNIGGILGTEKLHRDEIITEQLRNDGIHIFESDL